VRVIVVVVLVACKFSPPANDPPPDDAATIDATDAAVDAAPYASACGDCNDSNPCTVDTCVGTSCTNELLPLPTSCTGTLVRCAGEATCYARCTDARTFADAEGVCTGWSGHLVTLTSAAESSCIGTSLGVGGRAWIGTYQDDADPEPAEGWAWLSGTVSSFTFWAGGQPNNPTDILATGQDCAFAEGPAGQWFDHECVAGGTFTYVCER
jgi:hypothetical protein